MTTKQEISRRWMATESFEWTAGMLAHDHRDRFWRLFVNEQGGISGILEGGTEVAEWTGEWVEIIDAVPDLNDAATWNMLMAVLHKIGLLTEEERFMTACFGHIYIGGRFRLRRRLTKEEIKRVQDYDAKYSKSS